MRQVVLYRKPKWAQKAHQHINQIGLELSSFGTDEIDLRVIAQKTEKPVQRFSMCIPKENIDDVIDALKRLK